MRLLRLRQRFALTLRRSLPGLPACRRRPFVLLVCVAVVACSCDRPIRSGALLDAYRAAGCVEPTFAAGVEPPTRGWDSTVVIANGSKVTIRGAEMVGGQVNARYEADGRDTVVVDPGDYIYPNDVRFNDRRDRLYVKASGAAGGICRRPGCTSAT